MRPNIRLARLLLVAAVPLAILGVFFVLPVAGMISTGFWTDGTFDPAGVLEVLGRPRVHRVLWFTLWSATLGTLLSLALGLPAAHVLYRRRVLGGKVLRAALLVPFVLPTVVVGVAFRELISDSGPLGFLGLDGTPVAIIAGLVFFNASVVIRVVGGAWEGLDPRPAEAAAALGATPLQVLRTVTLPALRPAIVSAASVVFLFCATSFGVVLTLGGLRYSSVETEIYLLTTNLLDLQAAAALSILQLVVVVALLLAAARARRTPDSSLARAVARPRRVDRGDAPAVLATVLLGAAGRRPDPRAGRGVVAQRRQLEPGQLPRVGDHRRAAGAARAGHRGPGHLTAHGRRRDLDVAAARPLRGGHSHPALAVDGRAPVAHDVRRAVHAAPRGVGRDVGIRVPDHPRRATARPARLPAAGARRAGGGRWSRCPWSSARSHPCSAASTTGSARQRPPWAPRRGGRR